MGGNWGNEKYTGGYGGDARVGAGVITCPTPAREHTALQNGIAAKLGISKGCSDS